MKPFLGRTIAKIKSSYDQIIAEVKECNLNDILKDLAINDDSHDHGDNKPQEDMQSAVFVGLTLDINSVEKASEMERLGNVDFASDYKSSMNDVTNRGMIRLSLPDRMLRMKEEDKKR